jgi:iron complex outermembrane receptor protein
MLSRTKPLAWIVPLLAVPFGAAAHAEDGNGEPIVVHGAPLEAPPGNPAYGETIIDRDRLLSDASGRVENALKDIAGFSQFRRSDSRSANPSAQGANLRGIGGNAASRTLVLLDGVPMSDPFFGYIPYDAIIPERLSSVRVTRGGSTGAFGAGAVAGIIDFSSATRANLPLGSAEALFGSHDATELVGSVSPDVGNGFVSVSGRWDRGDGFQTTPESQRVAATVPARYDSWNAGVRAVAPINDVAEIQARMLFFSDDRTLRFAGADSHSEGQDASIRLISRGDWQVDALGYVQARNFSNVVISSSTFRKTLDQYDTPALGLGGKIELRPPVGGGHVLRFGTDARRSSGDMFEDAYNANLATNPLTERRHAYGRQFDWGAFVEDDWTLGDVILTGGGRVDRWTISDGSLEKRNAAGTLTSATLFPNRSGWEGGGRVGALWKPATIIGLRASAYTGFRLPTLNELYRSFTVFPVTTNANPNLTPEHLRGVEGGFDLKPSSAVTVSVTLFDNRLKDAIANVTIATNTQQRQNVPAIEARGVEFSGSAHLGQFDLTAAYSYTHSKVDAPGTSLDGLDPAQTPRHAASATLGWTSHGGTLLSATMRYVGRAFENDLNTDVLPDALTFDGFASIPLRAGVSLVLRAENIFDETVITRNQAGSIDLGAPRTLWAGIRFASDRAK